MKKKIITILLAFVGILSMASCSDDDGKWESMKWESNNYEKVQAPNYGKAISVPKEGGSYTFKCKNYKGFWLESITEGNGDKSVRTIPESTSNHEAKGSYTAIRIEDDTLTVTFDPNSTQAERYSRVSVTAGDIGYNFCFMQKP